MELAILCFFGARLNSSEVDCPNRYTHIPQVVGMS